ncbi:MAG: DUF2529 domain-containing protein [Bacillus sp. (in: Bacteria)]|nr:DUF2529 domain-containing protein [Bacillus sp. (in: firmicutes)]
MLKMFTTQLTGLFKRVAEKGEFSFEDGARLLAQAPIGDGKIYLFSTKEMMAVEFEAFSGAEPAAWATIFPVENVNILQDSDRVLIFTRFADDQEALVIASLLQEKGIPFVAVSSVVASSAGDLLELADVHIDLGLKKGLLPDDFGNRYGYPSSMVALFAYFGLKFTIDEILGEYEE